MRTFLSRFLLIGLAVAVVYAVVRLAGGGSHPADVVHLDGLDARSLRREPFTVGPAGARVAVTVVGSFEGVPGAAVDSGAVPPLAAYGWLVRRADDDGPAALVWRPRPRRRATRGSVFAVRDTLALAAGTYDAYFAAYGDPLVRSAAPPSDGWGDRLRAALSRGGRAWLGESDRWRLVVSGVAPADRAALARLDDDPDDDAFSSTVWTTGPVGSREHREALLVVSRRASIRVRATTEVSGRAVTDSAYVERLLDDGAPPRRLWIARADAGTWAGGSLKNRAYDTTLVLAPGLYRARFATDRSHAAGDWTANPPFDPTAWGLRVDAPRGSGVTIYDPLDPDSQPEIARVTCAGPSRDDRVGFTLTVPAQVVVTSTAEMSESSAWDYGSIERVAQPRTNGRPDAPSELRFEPVWTMAYARTTHAGAADRNRRETATLRLDPGRYALRFRTDGSHDCTDGYSGSPPDDPFWGIVLRAASPVLDSAAVQDVGPLVDAPVPAAPRRPIESLEELDPAWGSAPVLIRMTGLGANNRLRGSFTLDEPGRVRVVALGELLPSARLDWGWIADADGETVWEMTRANTRPAGGAPKNRRFDGVLPLPAGTYTVHFQTDGRHDASGFDGPEPRRASDWGIRVEGPLPEDG